jgi:glucokinase
MSAYSIGVDLGGTNLRVAAIDKIGQVLARVSEPAKFDRGPDQVAGDIAKIVDRMRQKIGSDSLAGVGIGVPGFVDIDAGLVVGAVNLPGFIGYPVRDRIQQYLGTAILLENDANAAALGEAWLGAGKGLKDLILLTLGTGIGGGIIADGRVLHGFQGMAGEFGHMTVMPEGNPCGCGNCGCLEKHASASAIIGMARMMYLGREINSAADVYALALEGNEGAKRVFESMGRALGIALANLINAFNYPLYLLSGGVLPAWDLFSPSMFAEVSKRSFTFSRTKTRIERGLLGADAGLYGAAYLPFCEHL